jgi:hypothetical protein
MMRMNGRTMAMLPLLLTVAVGAAGCGPEGLEGGQADPAGGAAAGVVVDSVVPIPVALERFRADLGPPPARLTGGMESAEAVARAIVGLVEAEDTLGFEAIALDRAEFAYLYYESSPLSRAPYELPPALMWFQLQQGNRTAVLRLLRELGGKRLDFEALACDPTPTDLGANLLWGGCRVRLRVDGDPRELRLFGALLERDGALKVLSFANDF